MRISFEIADFIKSQVGALLPDADVYLFGSRTDDNAKGGDVDIMVLGKRKLMFEELAAIEWKFISQFGDQKLDILSYTHDEREAFKAVAMQTAQRL